MVEKIIGVQHVQYTSKKTNKFVDGYSFWLGREYSGVVGFDVHKLWFSSDHMDWSIEDKDLPALIDRYVEVDYASRTYQGKEEFYPSRLRLQ